MHTGVSWSAGQTIRDYFRFIPIANAVQPGECWLGADENQRGQMAGVQHRSNLRARLLCNLPSGAPAPTRRTLAGAALAFGAARGQFDVAAVAHEVPKGQRLLFWSNATFGARWHRYILTHCAGSALYYASMLTVHVAAKRALELSSGSSDSRGSPAVSAGAGSLTFAGFSLYAQLFSKTGVAGPLDPALWIG